MGYYLVVFVCCFICCCLRVSGLLFVCFVLLLPILLFLGSLATVWVSCCFGLWVDFRLCGWVRFFGVCCLCSLLFS